MTHDETARCPVGFRCESCGAPGPELAVSALEVLGAMLCLTQCRTCRASRSLPSILVSTAAKLVAQHAEHVRPVAELRHVIRMRTGGVS